MRMFSNPEYAHVRSTMRFLRPLVLIGFTFEMLVYWQSQILVLITCISALRYHMHPNSALSFVPKLSLVISTTTLLYHRFRYSFLSYVPQLSLIICTPTLSYHMYPTSPWLYVPTLPYHMHQLSLIICTPTLPYHMYKLSLTICTTTLPYHMYPPWWGAAGAEIKVPSGENKELKRSPFKAESKSV